MFTENTKWRKKRMNSESLYKQIRRLCDEYDHRARAKCCQPELVKKDLEMSQRVIDSLWKEITPSLTETGILSMAINICDKHDQHGVGDLLLDVISQIKEEQKAEKAGQLAVELDAFAYEYDTYEYWDTVGKSEEERIRHVEQMSTDIVTDNVQDLVSWLKTVVEESEDEKESKKAKNFIERIQKLEEEE